MKKNVVVIAGPTGSGKTALSVEIAKRLGGEIISADSMQIYKYMAIEPEAEAAPAPSREVAMLDSEEAQHKKKPRHHHNTDNEKSRRPRTGRDNRDKGRHTAEAAEEGER